MDNLVPERDLTLGRLELEKILPHRNIAMCLDWIYYSPNYPNRITGNWEPDKWYFEGHFGILPGHWAGESACLAGGILGMLIHDDLRNSIPVLGDCHIHPESPVVPGLMLRHDVEIIYREGRLLKFKFQTFHLGKDNPREKLAFTGEFEGKAIPVEIFKKMLARFIVQAK